MLLQLPSSHAASPLKAWRLLPRNGGSSTALLVTRACRRGAFGFEKRMVGGIVAGVDVGVGVRRWEVEGRKDVEDGDDVNGLDEREADRGGRWSERMTMKMMMLVVGK